MPNSDMIGRAFEYICIQRLKDEISKIRPTEIIESPNYFQDKNDWDLLDDNMKEVMIKEVECAIPTIIELEPMIEENKGDVLALRLQSDREGAVGDVRDILLIRQQESWMIGISLKHNHFAVKHSRISARLDFGHSWLGIKCSDVYLSDIQPIFDRLTKLKGKEKWSNLSDKEGSVYIPLLYAFRNEILRDNELDNSVPSKLVEYLLGKYDFYKMVGLDSQKMTTIMAFDLRGTLNKPSSEKKPVRAIPISLLPTRIVSFEMKPNSNNTLELYMDNGWQFSFRIHNASTMVEPSLKFDVQIIGMPTTIITINCFWK